MLRMAQKSFCGILKSPEGFEINRGLKRELKIELKRELKKELKRKP